MLYDDYLEFYGVWNTQVDIKSYDLMNLQYKVFPDLHNAKAMHADR